MKTLENDHSREKPFSLLGLDQVFVNKILARNSSISCSSSSKHSSRVPFKWEIQPGKPKHPRTETMGSFTTVPSPPFLRNEEFSKPRVSSAQKRVSFWKKYSIKSLKAAKDDKNRGVDGLQNPGFSNSCDASLTPSSSSSSSSSSSVSGSTSSSLTSSTVDLNHLPSKIKSFAKGIIRYVY